MELDFGHCSDKLVSNCLSYGMAFQRKVLPQSKPHKQAAIRVKLTPLTACLHNSLILKMTVAEEVYFTETSLSFYQTNGVASQKIVLFN
jgi:hypothetical protein